MQVPPDCDPVFDELIKACWKHHPSGRLGIFFLLFQFNTHTDQLHFRPTFEAIVKKLSEYQKKLQTLYGDHAFELQQDTDDSDDEEDDSGYDVEENEFAVFKMERMDKIQRKVDHFWKALLDEGKNVDSIHNALLGAADRIMQLISKQEEEEEEEEETQEEGKHLLIDTYASIDSNKQGPVQQRQQQKEKEEEKAEVVAPDSYAYFTVDGSSCTKFAAAASATTIVDDSSNVEFTDAYVEINVAGK